ncbi:universal stress protein [Pedobacter sp. BS3]|uniref:universal stress protein n=1 Tax=Pedobacter sp. BS3 TaxID=2567937 RepID=UPI0011F045F2|nr:universal stress protein [Pedobacter sp. BS3]TZF83063.1 universal stress protein [Pedobacter sp. BS3]
MDNRLHIKKILIAVEDSPYSEKAAAYGFALATMVHADVVLLHVNEVQTPVMNVGDPLLNEPGMIMPELITAQEESSQKLLDRMAEKYRDENLQISTFRKLGNTRDEILNMADECNADLIILGTHGRTGFDHFITGSVSESVSRHAKCPVLIVPNK